jgi:leucyl/phenylalanyl-tRNA--protein transferase
LARRYADWDSFEFVAATAVATGAAGAPAAFCADLSPASVLGAYRRGLVPMPAADEYFRGFNEIRYEDQVAAGAIAVVGDEGQDPYWAAWWSPDPRPLIGQGGVHLGRNLRRTLRRYGLSTTANTAFKQVAEACREGREPRWLTDSLLGTLIELHGAGWAHSIEVWLGGELVGGALCIGISGLLSGDSLFGRRPGAAAVAVADMRARLVAAGGTVIDAQWDSPFLRSLGAEPVDRERFLTLLAGPAEPVPLSGDREPAQRLLGLALPAVTCVRAAGCRAGRGRR